MSFYTGDGLTLIEEYLPEEKAVFYLDPPYRKAARRLYRNWQIDHRLLFEKMATASGPFLMSYDNDEEIRSLARELGFQYRTVRMKNTHHTEMTELLIGRDFDWLSRNEVSPCPA
jgi:DNA adenine methylase